MPARRVVEIEEDRAHSNLRRAAREQTVTVASSDFVLQEGDEVNAVVAPDAIGDFAQRFRSTPLPPKVTA